MKREQHHFRMFCEGSHARDGWLDGLTTDACAGDDLPDFTGMHVSDGPAS